MLVRSVGRLAVVTLALVTLWPAAARADHCTPYYETDGGVVTIVLPCGPGTDAGTGHDDGGDDGGDGGSDDDVTCEWVDTSGHPSTEPDGSVWLDVQYECTDGDGNTWTEWRTECIENCPDPDAGPDWPAIFNGMLAEATAKVDPPLPGMRHSFDQPAANGQTRAIVLAETWWWAEGSLEPIVVYDEDPPVWVEVTATPGPLTIDPGDGTGMFTCPEPGMAWNHGQSYYDQTPGPEGACVHVYEQTFDEVTATMTITWTVTYEGFAPGLGAVTGTLDPIVREQHASYPVKELQSVIVHGEGGR